MIAIDGRPANIRNEWKPLGDRARRLAHSRDKSAHWVISQRNAPHRTVRVHAYDTTMHALGVISRVAAADGIEANRKRMRTL